MLEDILDIFEEILTDDEEDVMDFIEQPRQPRVFRQRQNYMEIFNDKQFIQRFRISKNSVEFVLNHISPVLQRPTNRNHALSPLTQLLVTLRYYATGSFIIVAGDFGGIHESTASVVIKNVSDVLASLAPLFIRLPNNENDLQQLKNKFFEIARFPNLIGAIDCTHIKIQSPGGDNAENFRNRKGWFSLNVQSVSDAELKFTNIVARWPGSTADRTIYASCRLKARLEERQYGNNYIVGDSGYTLSEHLITPLQNPQTRAEQLFNEAQIRSRNVVERQYGVWKRRFQVLRLEMRVKLETVMKIIMATAVLHNIAIIQKDEELEAGYPNDEEDVVNENIYFFENENGRVVRQNLIEYFAQL